MVDLADDLIIEAPVSIRQKVYDFLRNEILSNHIQSGDRLVEGRLARQINVSRTPVREALHILEMEGLIESIPRVGYRVKELRWEDVEELCEIRAVNEILAARWAMKRIAPEELAAMKENIDTAEAEIKVRPVQHGPRKGNRIRGALPGQFINQCTTGVTQVEQLGDLVIGLPGGIVKRLADDPVAADAVNPVKMSMPAGDRQGQKREFRRLFEEWRQDMPFHVVHGRQRNTE